MSDRFQIEEMVRQDAAGVVFRASDQETGAAVALRRFFPNGADGETFPENVRDVFLQLIERLKSVRSPALRSIIDGGCDAVDGMPFIATEWVEGRTLQDALASGPLPPEVAKSVLLAAIEASSALSEGIGAEAVWVELEPQAVIMSDDSARACAYWFCPARWLASVGGPKGYQGLADFTELIMGWQGRMITDATGKGLGGWMKWLRAQPPTTPLATLADELAQRVQIPAASLEQPAPPEEMASPQADPAPPRAVRTLATAPAASAKPVVIQRSSSAGVFALVAILAGIAGAFGMWMLSKNKNSAQPTTPPPAASANPQDIAPLPAAEPTTAPAPGVAEVDEVDQPAEPEPKPEPAFGDQAATKRANELARKLREEAAEQAEKDAAKKAETEQALAEIDQGDGIIRADQHDLLVARDGQDVIVGGVFQKTGFSRSGKTLYLFFTEHPGRDDARGAAILSRVSSDISEDSLSPLIGKKIRIHGNVKLMTGYGLNRPEIHISKLTDIEAVEE